MLDKGLPFRLLNDKQYDALPHDLKAAHGTNAAKATGLLVEECNGCSPYWLCSPSLVKKELVKVVSARGVQDDSQSPSWLGHGVRVFIPVTKTTFDRLSKDYIRGSDGKGYHATLYPDWVFIVLPVEIKEKGETKTIPMRCLFSKNIIASLRYDYGRGMKGKSDFKGSELQKKMHSPEFCEKFIDLSLYEILAKQPAFK